jgi:hypothetical protein
MSSIVAQWPVRMIAAPAIASKAPKTFSPGAMITASLLRGQLASIASSTLLPPVDDAEHQLQVNPFQLHAALQLAKKSPIRSSARRMFSVELA